MEAKGKEPTQEQTKEPRFITICNFYSTSGLPNSKFRCQLGYKADSRCHFENRGCKHYQPTEVKANEPANTGTD